MKYLGLIIITSVFLYPQGVWQWQNPYPQGNTLNAIVMFDSVNAIAAGNNGTIITTQSGGDYWQVHNNSVEEDLLCISFINQNEGWIGGTNGVIYKTINGGQSLILQNSGVTHDILSICFISPLIGFASGISGLLLKTDNGGNQWFVVNTGISSSISKILFTGTSVGYLFGEGGMIMKSSDAGNNWYPQHSGTTVSLTSTTFLNESTGWAAGHNGIILNTTDGGNTWIKTETNNSYFLKSISMHDDRTGWAVGLNGLILKTSDGVNWIQEPVDSRYSLNSISSIEGRTLITGEDGSVFVSNLNGLWEYKTYGVRYTLNSIIMVDYKNGWITGDHGTVFKTTDGGGNWIAQNSGVTVDLNDVCFINKNIAFIVGDSSVIIKTTDGGNTWKFDSTLYKKHYYYNLNSIEYTPRISIVVGDHGLIYVSNKDSLKNWTSNSSGNTDYFYVTSMDDHQGELVGRGGSVFWYQQWDPGIGPAGPYISLNQRLFGYEDFSINSVSLYRPWVGWVAGEHGLILKKTDGQNYRFLTQLDVQSLNSIQFINITRGFTCGTNGSLFKTIDGGFNWEKLYTGVSTTLNRIYLLDNNTGWLLGENGLIMKTVTGGEMITSVSADENHPYYYELSQNYPNPFNPETNIDFYLRSGGIVSIRVYNILGKEISTLGNGYFEAGNHTVTMRGTDLPSGVYFYRMHTEGFTQTKKMIILR